MQMLRELQLLSQIFSDMWWSAMESLRTIETRKWYTSGSPQLTVQRKMKIPSQVTPGGGDLAKPESPSCPWEVLNSRGRDHPTWHLLSGDGHCDVLHRVSFSDTNQNLLTVLWELRITGKLRRLFIFRIDVFHPMGDNLELIVEATEYTCIIIII